MDAAEEEGVELARFRNTGHGVEMKWGSSTRLRNTDLFRNGKLLEGLELR